MTTFILIILVWSGSSTAPPTLVRVDEYQTDVACEQAASIWRSGSGQMPPQTSREAVCIPGGRWIGVQ
jgi:hypothetical protein